jgi:hypothetical protein
MTVSVSYDSIDVFEEFFSVLLYKSRMVVFGA